MTLAEYIEGYIRDQGLTVREFAQKCGLSHTAVNRILHNNSAYRPNVISLYKIAEATGINLVTLIKMSYPEEFEKVEEEPSTVEQLAEAFEKAPPHIQEIILKIVGLKD